MNANETPAAGGGKMNQDEWLDRYTRRIMAVSGLSEQQARRCAEAETFEVLSDGFEDDPEAAADMEMSYWDGD